MAVKKTPAPSKTVTKEQITELSRLNVKQSQADAAELAKLQAENPPYVSPTTPVEVPSSVDEAVKAAAQAAAEADRIQKEMDLTTPAGYVSRYTTPYSGITQQTAQAVTPKFTATDGTVFSDEASYKQYQDYIDGKRAFRQSAFDTLYEQFSQYGLGSLVEPIRGLIQDSSVSPSEFTLRLRQTDAYKRRFAANEQRLAKGLSALSEGEYIAMEDQYQNIMRRYGLPETYYKKDELGTQKGFQDLLANDVSADELKSRIDTAQTRVLNANPEVKAALRQFYPGITDGDILGYVLDPKNALTQINRKVTAAEIGGAAMAAGLAANAANAELLAGYGVTGQAYKEQTPFITTAAQRGQQLADIYGMGAYGQTQAEQEAFNLAGGTEATAKRKKLTELEKAAFGGSAGTSGGALSRDRAISNYMMGSPGAGAF